jgi:hypothetical protein
LNWLKSWGIDPALKDDGEHHYFEFDCPDDWDKEKRIEFRWQLCEKTSGAVFCRCGLWLDEDHDGEVLGVQCEDCGRKYLFCKECAPVDDWGGCDCGAESSHSAKDVYWKYVELAGEEACADAVVDFFDRNTAAEILVEHMDAHDLEEFLHDNVTTN